MIKQVIVMRTDLNMRKGKMITQGAHASMAWMAEKLLDDADGCTVPWLSEAQHGWLHGLFTKICVRVNSEDELLMVWNAAREAGLDAKLITDSGLTEFKGVPTRTCLAIGPDEAEKIDAITGKLELL